MTRPDVDWLVVGRAVTLAGCLGLLLAVFHLYELETPMVRRMLVIAFAGFAVHAILPRPYRLWFFLGLSALGIFTLFPPMDAAWLIGAGLVLLALCHLPVPFGLRVTVLAGVGGLLAAARVGWVGAPWGAAVWPILASMFMFRLAIYLHTLHHAHRKLTLPESLAYFFMLPNAAYPFFPVVDCRAFTTSYFDREDLAIYERGVVWIARGVTHLLLYRVVYLYAAMSPADVLDLGDLVQFLLGTFLLYLRVSGQFHLAIGVMHLFGFRLPETNHLYLLASSFSNLWRRINIYWKDFMMNLVYYPTFFRIRRLGNDRAIILSTIVVFLVTWMLHSYQWFWIRGSFPLTPQDAVFWSILCGLVIAATMREMKRSRARTREPAGWSARRGLGTVATLGTLCVLWSLWSADSVTGWIWLWRAGGRVELVDLALVLALLGGWCFVGGGTWGARRREAAASPTASASTWEVARYAVILATLTLAGVPSVRDGALGPASGVVATLQRNVLNTQDARLQHQGYYENLDLRGQLNAQIFDVLGPDGEAWETLGQQGILRDRSDLMLVDLAPETRIEWNSAVMTTNRWGMRDRDYPREKPPGTFRIALIGPSHAMGNNVSDGEAFEALVEERLAREPIPELGGSVEILNFSVDGYTFPQQLAMLESRAAAFDPDVVVVVDGGRARYTTESYLGRLVRSPVEIPYAGLRELLDDAGVLDIGDADGVPVPFGWGRQLVSRVLGVPVRMPWGEVNGRIRGLGYEAVSWALTEIADVSRRIGAVPVMMALNAVEPSPAGHEFIVEAALEAGLLPIDLGDLFEGRDPEPLRVAPWDNHPNPQGHRLIADRLYEEFANHASELVRPMAERAVGSP